MTVKANSALYVFLFKLSTIVIESKLFFLVQYISIAAISTAKNNKVFKVLRLCEFDDRYPQVTPMVEHIQRSLIVNTYFVLFNLPTQQDLFKSLLLNKKDAFFVVRSLILVNYILLQHLIELGSVFLIVILAE